MGKSRRLDGLTPQEEVFVAVYLFGDEDVPPEDPARAYRAAYSEQKADHHGGQARSEGAKILARPTVAAEIERRREEADGAAALSRSACLRMLRDAYNKAKIQENPRGMIEATKAIATLQGFNTVTHEHVHRLDEDQARRQAVQMLRQEPALLEQLREEAPDLLPELTQEAEVIEAEEVEPEENG